MKTPNERCMNTVNMCINAATLLALIVTAVYVILYWSETLQMKEEMIRQSKIASQSIKVANLPLLEAQIESEFDLVLLNKGNGPALKILVRRSIDTQTNQKMATSSPPNAKLRSFIKNRSIIAEGGRLIIHHERSNSYEDMKIIVNYHDLFGERFESVFKGNRDGLTLVSYPIIDKLMPDEETGEER